MNNEATHGVSVCDECSELLVLTEARAREPTTEERASAERDQQIRRAIKKAGYLRECREAAGGSGNRAGHDELYLSGDDMCMDQSEGRQP
jgi:hypothetical protein